MLGSVLAVTALVAAGPRSAGARDQDELHRDELRQAVEAGQIQSLAGIVKSIRSKLPGEIVGVKVEHKDGRWRYEFRVIDGQGRLFEAYVDARTGEIERIKEK